jgi:hypothetical protein
VAKFARLRHPGALAISRWSSRLAAARSGHGRAHGSREKGGAKPCQGDAPEHGEEDRVGGRSRGVVAHQKLAALSGSIGGATTSGVRSLVAISARVWRETSAGGGGVI